MSIAATEPPAAILPGPGLAVSLVVAVVGAVLAVIGGFEAIAPIVDNVGSPVYTTPADVHRHLSTGSYDVFVSSAQLASISPQDVTVTSAGGQTVPTSVLISTEELTRDSTAYQAQVRFTIAQAGTYDVQVGGPAGVRFIVSKSFGSIARRVAAWFGLLAVGFLVLVAGVTMAIVGGVRRGRIRNPRPVPVPTVGQTVPPGWYPDPSIAGQLRWWDGTRWTDQTSPQHPT